MKRILVVDDEESIVSGFLRALELEHGRFEVVGAGSGEAALELLTASAFDLAFVDLKMPGLDGLAVLARAREVSPRTDVILMTGYGSVDTAVRAMKDGAVDYLQKPFTREELLTFVESAERLQDARIRRREEEAGFERLSRPLRVQHIFLMTLFGLLTVTGVPLFFPELFKGVFFFEDSSMLRGLLHRVAAVGLMILSAWHVGYVIMTEDGHRNLRAILPKMPADLREFIQSLAFKLGLREERPRVGKYNWIEKFEYFAVIWGTVVMVGTGLFLWFADGLLRLFPLWVIDLAKVVHRYEAILAILSIVVWHFYNVHFRPDLFPMSRTWLDGRMARHEMILEHPIEYEALTGRRAIYEPEDEEGGPR
jgi:formate dehydrogenase subunit gamma